jgi:gliding motility-associated-like protein
MEDYLIYLYWGSENGLFENRLVQSNNQGEIKQFLKGIKVNKINNILGLTSFGGQIFKSNLLVGTEKGLYFSNSTAHTSTIPPDLFITHMDDLGNISVNDIQINVANVSQTYPLVDCEEGAWVGTDNGLYYIKPDYGKYNNLQNARLVHFKDQSNSVDLLNFCSQVTTSLLLNDDVASSNIQWYKDSKEIPEAISKELDINSPGDYYAVLYDPCSDIHIETNHLKVTLNASPVFTFNYPDELRYCKGTPVTLKAGGSAAYQYRWYKDGALTGDVTPSLIITQAGKYKVEVSSCDGSWVPSKEVQVALINIPVPVIVTDKPAYCIDDNATLSIAVPTDPNYTINWYKDNILLTADVNHTSVITNNPGVYTVTIVNNQSNSDGTICNQTFVSQPLSFNPPPTVSIQKIVKTTLCDGQTVDLKVTYTTGTVKWSTGETSDQIKVSNSGSYKATVTTAAGCSVDATTDVQFFPNPVLNIPNAGICVASHKTATLTAPPGLASYIWNGQTGSNTYTTDHPQTVTVIVTDANGCQATQQIQVNDECPDVKIPNAFTPNGDGINDTWDILGLEYDPTALVRVFTRYGQQVFQSKGYGTPWNGEAKGQKLPTGAYYYIITAKNGSQTYSGEVTIIH